MLVSGLILLGICLFLGGYAQEKDIRVNTDWDHERHAWNAWWISHPTAPVFDYGVILFRRNFHLTEVPVSAKVWVSGDNRYRLCINGKQILSGPARGDFMNWRYEEIDLAPYLRTGLNVLAAEVYNFGKYRPVAQFSRQTAFVLAGEGALGDSISTGRQWKVAVNPAYTPIPVTKQMVRGFYVAGPTDQFNAVLQPWGWEKPDFDDSRWLAPEMISIAAGRGYMHGIPWHLVPRSIPLMEHTPQRMAKIVRCSGIRPEPEFLAGKKKWVIPQNRTVSILLDQQRLTLGYPQLSFSGGQGAEIRISYAESLYDSLFRKGNRNVTEGKKMIGYYDIVQPDGGAQRLFTPLWLRTWRYIQLDIHTASENLVLDDFSSVFTAYPFVRRASFVTGNAFLDSVWEAGWLTARLCAGETYMDCPYYEQLQYLGDTRIQSLISLYLAGDDRLMKNAIRQADESRIPEGLTLGRGPSAIPQITPPFSLYWVDMVYDFWMHRSDDQFVNSMLPGIEAVLGWFERRVDSTGMPGPSDWFNFSDWTSGFQVGVPIAADTGHSTLLALNYVYSLQRAAELFNAAGKFVRAREYSAQAEAVRAQVRLHCLDKQRGLLRDAPGCNVYSQHANIFGILTGLFLPEEKNEVLRKILSDKDLIQATVYFRFYLFEALKGTPQASEYLGMLGPWDEMLKMGLTTFREDDYEDRSDCHAWSASPIYHFLSLVGGVRPGSPGFKTVLIEPAPGSLPSLEISMPHPAGTIGLNLKFAKNGTVSGIVSLPEGVTGIFIWHGKQQNLIGGKQTVQLWRE